MTVPVAESLLVDLYELTMAAALRHQGMAEGPATFSLFVRHLPADRGYLVAAGLDDALAWLEEFRFGTDERAVIDGLGLFDDDVLEWLGQLRFTGTVRAVPEGTIVFANEPILEVDAPIVEAQVAETFLLNQISLQTMLATKAARCRHAAAGRDVIDFALRRSQGIDAGMKLSRVSRLVGLAGTSNVAGAARYGLPARGTMAHSFVQAHADETEGLRAFARVFGERSILLVDTYDTPTGVERAIEVASELRADGIELAGIRLDSGDLGRLARDARLRLDEAGFPDMRIVVSGGLDEYGVDDLVRRQQAPIDGFGLGTALGVSDDAPTLDAVYKLVAFDGRPVRKTSVGKASWPGPKQVWRAVDQSGDLITLVDEEPPDGAHEPLLVEVMRGGRRTVAGQRDLSQANQHFEGAWADLPDELKELRQPPEYPVEISPKLRQLTEELDANR